MRDTAIYILFLVILCTVGVTYENISAGLASKTENGPFYCNTLLSSGSDDTVMIAIFSLFFFPLAVRLVLIYQDISFIEVGLFYIVLALAVSGLFLASLDCAEILYTAFGIPDLYLATALIALPGSALILGKIRSGR